MVLGQIFNKNHFLTSFRLEVSFSYLWVDEKELVRSVLLGKWLSLYLHLMYEIHKRNSKGEWYLNRPATFYGLYTCDWHTLDVDKDGIVCFAIQKLRVISV